MIKPLSPSEPIKSQNCNSQSTTSQQPRPILGKERFLIIHLVTATLLVLFATLELLLESLQFFSVLLLFQFHLLLLLQFFSLELLFLLCQADVITLDLCFPGSNGDTAESLPDSFALARDFHVLPT